MNRLIFKLLNKSFINIFLISIVVFFSISLISIAIYKYNTFLQTSFAKKQPHIVLRYINDNMNVNIQKEISRIKNILKNDLKNINSFTTTTKYIKLQKGLGAFRGKVKIIGLGLDEYPITYDFNKIDIRLLEDYNIRLTGIEVFYIFKKKYVLFNQALQKSFLDFAPSVSTNYGLFINRHKLDNITFIGVLDDMKDTPILFMSRRYFNKLFKFSKNHVNGFYINIKNQDKLKDDIRLLSMAFKNAQILSWRDINQKQNKILNVFSFIGNLIQIILLILGIVAILVVFINGIVTKSRQIKVLNILGARLLLKINMLFFMFIVIGEIIGVILGIILLGKFFSASLIISMIITPIIALILNTLILRKKL